MSVANSAGTVLAINAYDEYGIPASTNLGRFGYTGQTWLPEVGLYYYKARMYSPTLGRFMQTDPIGYADGMNWYAYVGGDPVNSVDPLGRSGCAARDCDGGPDDSGPPDDSSRRNERVICATQHGQRGIPDRNCVLVGGNISDAQAASIARSFSGFILLFGGSTRSPLDLRSFSRLAASGSTSTYSQFVGVVSQFFGFVTSTISPTRNISIRFRPNDSCVGRSCSTLANYRGTYGLAAQGIVEMNGAARDGLSTYYASASHIISVMFHEIGHARWGPGGEQILNDMAARIIGIFGFGSCQSLPRAVFRCAP